MYHEKMAIKTHEEEKNHKNQKQMYQFEIFGI